MLKLLRKFEHVESSKSAGAKHRAGSSPALGTRHEPVDCSQSAGFLLSAAHGVLAKRRQFSCKSEQP